MSSGEIPSVAVLLLALAIDVLFGELPPFVHPVVWIGTLTAWAERILPEKGPRRQLVAGTLLALSIPVGSALLSHLLLSWLTPWPAARFGLSTLLLSSMFALRGLGRAALDVRHALVSDDIDTARRALRSLCSRDASQLQAPCLAGATVESLAENASDSFIAPVFYYVLFGIPGVVFYRAANTLDAMVGYHGPYEYLGKASARLDDLLNYVPARLTAGCLLLAGRLCRRDTARAVTILRRDGGSTESPNAGRPMATMAGLLGVRLEKTGQYGLGDATQTLTGQTIDAAWRLVAIAAAIAAAAALTILGWRHVAA